MLKRKNTIASTTALLQHPAMPGIIEANRQVINGMGHWINEAEHAASYFGYGIPPEIFKLVHLPVNDEVIYTDLLAAAARTLGQVSYLELGVSVGKNFLPMVHQLAGAALVAWDIENPAPAFKAHLSNWQELASWPSKPESVRTEPARWLQWQHGATTGHYLSADVLDSDNWATLSGKKFNLVFSDALHSPEAILFEYEMLVKYRLLAKDFIIFYDDLHAPLYKAFQQIAEKVNRRRLLKPARLYKIDINGWLGQNYPHKHPVGIISTIDLG